MSGMNPAETIMHAATTYWLSRCVHVVASLGVADAVGDSPTPIADIASRVGANPAALSRVFRLLASHGIFEIHAEGYAHNDASRLLRSDDPRSLRPYAQMIGSPLCWASYGLLEHSIRTGRPATAEIAPDGFFGYFGAHPEEGKIFDAAMGAKAHEQIGTVLSAYDFSGFATISDIGGGGGHLLRAVLDAVPGAQGVLFDLPHVIQGAAAMGGNRLSLVAGDFFKDALPVSDAYLLMEVIHDWGDPEAIAVLKAIRAAAPATAKVVIVENVVPEAPGPHFSKGLDITMLAMTGGLERTPAEYDALFEKAGLRRSRVFPTPSVTVVEAVPV